METTHISRAHKISTLAAVVGFMFIPAIAQAQVSVSLIAPPVVELGKSVQITWLVTSTSGNSSCTASSSEGDWNDSWIITPLDPITGVVSMLNITTTRDYTLTCVDGVYNDSDMVTVAPFDDSCTLDPGVYDYVIPIGGASLISNDLDKSTSTPVSVNIPAETYQVTLESYDGDPGRGTLPPQNFETWELVLRGGGSHIATSSATADLPDDDFNLKNEVVDAALILSADIDEVQAFHAKFPNGSSANSVHAVCAALDLVGANTPPTASITGPGSNQTIIEGETVTFLGDFSDPDQGASPVAWDWRLNGCLGAPLGVDSDKQVNPYTFTTANTYTVYLNVQDDQGAWSTNCPFRTITVNPLPPPPQPKCDDNIDNDQDGLTDEDDPGCWTDPYDPVCELDPLVPGCYDDTLDGESYCGNSQCEKKGSPNEHFLSCRVDCPIKFFNF